MYKLLTKKQKLITFLTILIPFMVWATRFYYVPFSLNSYSIGTYLAQICAVIGFTLLGSNIFYAGKYQTLDRLLLPLDKQYQLHSLNGKLALSLLLIHPFFVGIRNIDNGFRFVIKPLVEVNDPTFLSGKIMLTLLIFLAGIAIFRIMPYERFRKVHSVIGIVLILAIPHFLNSGGSNTFNPFLRYYLILIAVSAIISWVTRSILGSYLKSYIESRVVEVTVEKDITLISMKLIMPLRHYEPGKFAFFKFKSEQLPVEEHPFTIFNYEDDVVTIAAKKSGDFTNMLDQVRVGDRIDIFGPFGSFTPDQCEGERVLIAGGIGVTPFYSHLKATDELIYLFYSFRSDENNAPLGKYLKKVEGKHQIYYINSTKEGRLTVEKIKDSLNNPLSHYHYYLCGPSQFVDHFIKALMESNVKKEHLHFEKFQLA